MNINEVLPSGGKYITAGDLQNQEHLVQIDRVTLEEMRDGEKKPVIYFAGREKGMTLNKTNAAAIAALYGAETDNWRGQQIILFPMMVEFQGRPTMGVRVRGVLPQAGSNQQFVQQGGNFRSSPGPQNNSAPPPPNGPEDYGQQQRAPDFNGPPDDDLPF